MVIKVLLTAGQFLQSQIKKPMTGPEELDRLPPSSSIYHALLDPEFVHPMGSPSAHSILEETQTQVFAGKSSGLTLMHGRSLSFGHPRCIESSRRRCRPHGYNWTNLRNWLTWKNYYIL
jgi:hypothetical protein